jgi:hypothetical protein
MAFKSFVAAVALFQATPILASDNYNFIYSMGGFSSLGGIGFDTGFAISDTSSNTAYHIDSVNGYAPCPYGAKSCKSCRTARISAFIL